MPHRLDTTHFVTTRNFYDGQGHLVETRTPAPGGNDVVVFSVYDKSQRLVFKSIPYFVTSGTGYSTPNYNQPGTTYTYDGVGRQLSATDALSDQTTTAYNVVIRAGSPDGQPYEETDTYDPLNHFSASLVDAWGRTQYVRRYTGGNPYALYATVNYKYDVNGNLIQIVHPDGVTTTNFTYDMAGRQIGLADPDRGSETYTYDQDGNLTESVDARGSSGTVWSGFDGIDRISWRNTTNTQTGAFNVFCYDNNTAYNSGTLACTTPLAINGIGRQTFETFTGSGGLTGTEATVYDARGQTTLSTLKVGTTSYPLSAMTYNDAGTLLTQTYPDGEVVTNGYDSVAGWLQSVSTSAQSFPILANAQYAGTGGAFGQITGAGLDTTQSGGGSPIYNFTSTFDVLGRASDITVKNASNVVFFDQARTFDAAGNVTTANITLSAGSDHQAFCYDEQNRLTSAASNGTVPCQTLSAGTLTAANYNQTFAYDTMGRLANGPLGAYTFGNSAHVHAATSIGSGYTAAYDASGDMTCRAPSSSTTCSGTQTGAQLGFNNQGLLSTWQNQPSSPTTTANFLYDGSGNRVAQTVTSGSTTTTTVYVANAEEDSTTGSTTTKTTYYYANGWRFALATNGTTFDYLASDGLGSANVTLSSGGSVIARILYAPYGTVRYSSGTMPTDRGFTGQVADAATGLDNYVARYYDPVASEFATADTELPGNGFDVWALSRYAYVEGNPVLRNDPSGHDWNWWGAVTTGVTDYLSVATQAQSDFVTGVADFALGAAESTPPVGTILAVSDALDPNSEERKVWGILLNDGHPSGDSFQAAIDYGVGQDQNAIVSGVQDFEAHPFKALGWLAAAAGTGFVGGWAAAGADAGPLTVDDFIQKPSLATGMNPDDVMNALGRVIPENWRITRLWDGTHKGQGWVLREWAGRGWSGRSLRWHPGGWRYFDGRPYWKATGGPDSERYPARSWGNQSLQ